MERLSGIFIFGLYTCRLISSVINNTEPPALLENMSIDSLYAYQLSQDVISISYVALARLDSSLDLREYIMENKRCILREARFDIAGQELYNALEKDGIPFLPLKGAILKALYPKPYHRYFTDIDIYVEDDFDKAERLLLCMGYEKITGDYHNDIGYAKKPSLHVELHKELFPDDYDFKGYFDEPYKRTRIKEGYKYYHVFNDDFFIHVLCHLYKHFTFGGCGLKMYLDIYVMLKKMSLDMDYIRSELRSLGMEGFLDTTLKLTAFLFDGEKPNDELIEIAEFVFNNSTFGNADNRLVLDYDKRHGEKRTTWGNIKYFADRWQLKYSQMKQRYKMLKYLPFLLPFCYIHRFFAALIFRRNVIKTSFDDVGKMNSEFSNYINHIMEISGAKSGITKGR